MSSEIAIKVENLSKCYQIYGQPRDRLKQFILPRLQLLTWQQPKQYFREFWALKDISLEIRKGETIGIIGRNGSGKSTLLQIITGTLSPTTGSVTSRGRIAALLELGSGFNPDFTGRENVYLNAVLLGLSEAQIQQKFAEIEAFADIGEFIDQPVKTYSSGMYVRLAFAVVAHVDAEILVIDEALAVGDALFTQKCMRFLRAFKEHGILIFVSHDTSAVINLCDTVLWLDHGQRKAIGNPKVIAEDYLAALYEHDSARHARSTRTDKNSKKPAAIQQDPRWSKINASPLRNSLEIFKFDASQVNSFGQGGASIENVCLKNNNGEDVLQCTGGELVELQITIRANSILHQPIVGFSLKDRLGQVLFGDNTYLTYLDHDLMAEQGCYLIARFQFQMPILPHGDYSIATAVATGTQMDHQQEHWIHDALIVRSLSSSVSTGLIGIPMHHINLEVLEKS